MINYEILYQFCKNYTKEYENCEREFEKMRMNCVKDFLYKFEHADQEKDPEKYRLFYAWQIYGHLYFYLTERDKI